MKRLTGAALALVGALVLTQGAQAFTTYATGDLMIGFTQAGNANDLVFDLGNITTLTSGQTWNLGTDINGTFSGSGVQWGVVAVNANTANVNIKSIGYTRNTLWVTVDSSASAPLILSNSAQSAIRSNEGVLSNSWANQTVNTSYANGLKESASDPNSWTSLGYNGGGASFGLSFQVDSDLSDGLSLYKLEPTTGSTDAPATLLGTFSYNSSTGTVTYTATPEPSTYALIGAAGLLLLVARRRIFAQA